MSNPDDTKTTDKSKTMPHGDPDPEVSMRLAIDAGKAAAVTSYAARQLRELIKSTEKVIGEANKAGEATWASLDLGYATDLADLYQNLNTLEDEINRTWEVLGRLNDITSAEAAPEVPEIIEVPAGETFH